MMAAMEPLLYTAGVDIVLAGHVHAYERSVRLCVHSFFFLFSCATIYRYFGKDEYNAVNHLTETCLQGKTSFLRCYPYYHWRWWQ